jgi:AraC-like DNA-binding protein
MHQLRALGISAEAEAIYLDLIARGALDQADLVQRHGADLDVPLRELAATGLIERSYDKVLPQPPHLAMEAVAQRRTTEAQLARESASLLSDLWTAGIGQQTYVELLPSAETARAVLNQVQVDAQKQVRAMTVGNLASPNHQIVEGLFDALSRGVSYEVIYGTRVLQDSEALRKVQQCVDAGEQARVFPQVPLNLTVVDDRWALVSARTTVGGIVNTAAMVVHHSPFLTGLVGVFDALWRVSVPITGGTENTETIGAPALETKRLLTYLSAGLTDESIAREFGVSERTVARRISRLQEVLGAQTRFQLGVQASRQNWL